MAILKDTIFRKQLILKSHHVFGRNRTTANTFLEDRGVSQIHASVRWDGQQWRITDHSRNGTWVDDIRLVAGKSTSVKKGNSIRFGPGENKPWEIINLDPPVAVLMPLGHSGPTIELERFHVLPNEKQPNLSVYVLDTGSWVYEDNAGVVTLNDGDIVRDSATFWQFFDAGPVDATLEDDEQGRLVQEPKLDYHFDVSPDEEHVFLKLHEDNNRCNDLGERVHHYLLLILARQRLQDARDGEDPSVQGWMDAEQLASMLRIEPTHLNIQIYRARKQVHSALPEMLNLPNVIERRVGELRFGSPNFQIGLKSNIEGRLREGMFVDEL